MSASKWAGMPFCGFDVETTGTSVWEDRIVTASIVTSVGVDDVTVHEWLINPGVSIPDGAAAIHGITTEKAQADGVDPAKALYEIVGLVALALGRRVPVVAMNAAFDLTMLEVECRRHGVDGLVARLGGAHRIAPVIDPYVLDKYADPYRKGGRKLVNLCEHYNVPLAEADAHNSTADTLATCHLWPKVMEWHPGKFRGHTLQSLHQAQVGWRREQMDGLREYFDKKGTAHDGCDGSWPLLTPPAGLVPGARTAVPA